jgi:hypothetical protein
MYARQGGVFRSADTAQAITKQNDNNNARTRSSGRPGLLSTGNMQYRVSQARSRMARRDIAASHRENTGSHESKAWFGSYSSCGPGVVGSIIVRSVIGGDHRRSVPSDGSMHCLAANCREQQICLSRNERTSSLTGKALSDSPAYRCCYLQMSAEAQVRAES